MSDLGASAPAPPEPGERILRDAAGVLGAAPDHVELLAHNPLNAVTGGIWRLRAGDRSVVVKVVTDGRVHTGPSWWAASADDRHWNSWRREVLAYRHDLARWFRPAGVDAPQLLRLDEHDHGTAVLWLEDVAGRSGTQLAWRDVVDLAARLGEAQGRAADAAWDEPWLSQRYLRSYSAAKPVDVGLLDDDRAWTQPRVERHLGHLRDPLRRLHHERTVLLGLSEACPRTLCHLDVWPANVVARADGGFALVDWTFCGDGAIGEDLANLLPDAVFDLFLPHEPLAEMALLAEAAYLEGVRGGGWAGDERWVRLGVRAAAVKYHWLVYGLLARAGNDPAVAYGGRQVDADELYAARAAGLALLCTWADEARDLAADLGVTA